MERKIERNEGGHLDFTPYGGGPVDPKWLDMEIGGHISDAICIMGLDMLAGNTLRSGRPSEKGEENELAPYYEDETPRERLDRVNEMAFNYANGLPLYEGAEMPS